MIHFCVGINWAKKKAISRLVFYNLDCVIPKYGETSPEEIRLRSECKRECVRVRGVYVCVKCMRVCESLYCEHSERHEMGPHSCRCCCLNSFRKTDISLMRDLFLSARPRNRCAIVLA